MSDLDIDDLAAELAEFDKQENAGSRSVREERIIFGFEDIQRFVDHHEHEPLPGEERDIFERLYAVRLNRLRALDECKALLTPYDRQGLLNGANVCAAERMDDDEIAAELSSLGGEITELRHVRANAEKRVSEEVATRVKCGDFDRFKPLFETVRVQIQNGVRQVRPFELKAEIQSGAWFIVGGQTAYVAEMGEVFTNAQGRTDARLRVVFDNGTESNMLMRSLQRALHKDDAGRRITEATAGPLFANCATDDDLASGTIYVLRSKSDHPTVAANRNLVHKIGVTNVSVEQRISGARLQPTFMMADVEIVATYDLFNINRSRLERLIHRVFYPARLDVTITDRFGKPVVPQEWFLVPLFVIDEVVERIKDGSIKDFVYDPSKATLVPVSGK